MYKYILRRLLLMIPILFGLLFIIFTILSVMPGEPGRLVLGVEATAEQIHMFNVEFGLDKPFLVRFGQYLINIVTRFDFGVSYRTRLPVVQEVMARFPHTLTIALFSIVAVIILGVPLGILSAIKRASFADASITVYAMFLASIPEFWLGMVLIFLFALVLGWFPVFGTESWKSFVLPIITLAFPSSSWFIRYTRVLMLDTVNQEYIKTARAKGVHETVVIWKHALKNAVLPLINTTGIIFSNLLGGTVIIETIFSINGIGLLLLNAVRNRDIPLVMCASMFIAVMFCIIVLLIDLLQAFIDPRVRARYTL